MGKYKDYKMAEPGFFLYVLLMIYLNMNLSPLFRLQTFGFIKTLNVVISILIALLAIYIFIYPHIPDLLLKISMNKYQGYTYQSEEAASTLGDLAKGLPQIPDQNMLVIPKIYVNAPIVEGDESVLMEGMWHRPASSSPEKGGNTVIAGHRNQYINGPHTLYHLNKVEINDLVLVYWEGEEYVYKVYETTEVGSSAIEIEFNTKDPIITLFSCTQEWESEDRIVVKGLLQ